MTDHYAVVNPQDLTPVVPPQEGSHVCEICQRSFSSAGALGVHFRSHGSKKKPCPECGLEYFPGPGMSRHRQTAHGAVKANGQEAKKTLPPKMQRKLCPECHKPIRVDNLKRHRRDVHGQTEPQVLTPVEEHEQSDLTEEDLFTAAIGMLFPSGVIPVAKVQALFAWRDATRRMLEEVSDG